MKLILLLAFSAIAANAADTPNVVLATFDGKSAATTFKWRDLNDPVMGGASTSSFSVENGAGVFNGTCAIVGFLKAPGFAKITTEGGSFADASTELAGGIQLRVRSTTASYKGFKVAFAATGVPKTSIFGGGSFKAGFMLKDTADWQVVSVPFTDFSYDWSGYTGRCDSKDPGGQQHHCCSDDAKYCPTAKYLGTLTDLEIWAEGVEGDFHIEIDWIGADKGAKKVLAVKEDAPEVILATFDGADKTTFNWKDMNDPVMGGASTSTFTVANKAGVFNGTCAIVSFLKAPGFAKISAGGSFADASATLAGGIQLRVRSTTATYKGFKVAFSAPGVPRTSIYGGGSYKAGFMLKDSSDWQVVSVPFSDFSYDWSGYTGRCDTKDPNGQQHHCCSDDAKYCPQAKFLSTLSGLEVWAEGVQGDFHLEIDWIGADSSKPARRFLRQ